MGQTPCLLPKVRKADNVCPLPVMLDSFPGKHGSQAATHGSNAALDNPHAAVHRKHWFLLWFYLDLISGFQWCCLINKQFSSGLWHYILTHWPQVVPYWVIVLSIGSRYCLVPDGTMPWLQTMFTYHYWDPVGFIWVQFHKKYSRYLSVKCV